jgi:hypothetical protein
MDLHSTGRWSAILVPHSRLPSCLSSSRRTVRIRDAQSRNRTPGGEPARLLTRSVAPSAPPERARSGQEQPANSRCQCALHDMPTAPADVGTRFVMPFPTLRVVPENETILHPSPEVHPSRGPLYHSRVRSRPHHRRPVRFGAAHSFARNKPHCQLATASTVHSSAEYSTRRFARPGNYWATSLPRCRCHRSQYRGCHARAG